MSVATGTRRTRALRRAWVAVVVVALAIVAVGLESLVPGPTLRWAPFAGVGTGEASSGPLSVVVHGATVADAVVVDGERRETTGAFVVLDVTIASSEELDLIDRDLVVDGRVYESSTKGPSLYQESHPAPGLPVRGDLVFEVDAALLAGGTSVELHLAPGFDAAGDLQPQVVVRTDVAGDAQDVVEIAVLSR
ncbi:hypothetical protein GCM10009846_21140 [Agrococcus versicolor]|uniref:DUF4352 domain-containing protein n=1 Tax=Agrococcus versicolor TaxID=501482 RepID=A0ABP5MIW3_9MICO